MPTRSAAARSLVAAHPEGVAIDDPGDRADDRPEHRERRCLLAKTFGHPRRRHRQRRNSKKNGEQAAVGMNIEALRPHGGHELGGAWPYEARG